MTRHFWNELDFSCPVCRSACRNTVESVDCTGCGATYQVRDGVPYLVPRLEGKKAEIEQFWSGGVRRRREIGQTAYTASDDASLRELLDAVERRYGSDGLFSRELPLSTVRGRRILEVGCGSGAASLVLCRHGAHAVAGDLSPLRAENAARLHEASFLAEQFFVGVQLDAERLPFPDQALDVVMSNGVLHHTSDTGKAIQEVHRVLKPGGTAAIMLYARHSLMYAALWAYHGVGRGLIFRDRDWLSHVSEQSDIHGGTVNPVTRAYSNGEVRQLFAPFSSVEIRQARVAVFSEDRFPRLTKVLSRATPWLGWCLYMRAVK